MHVRVYVCTCVCVCVWVVVSTVEVKVTPEVYRDIGYNVNCIIVLFLIIFITTLQVINLGLYI